ncbi:MAG: hypothetical protein Q7Q71_13225 [Verrucomicrobiota bacterium JB023]|nr:hypothetical protein [Verrucomicrobiota bacterium JB023]
MRTFVFSNHFEAMVAAAELRNEGYSVEIYDESVAALWGPMSVGGVRMVVEPIEGAKTNEEVDTIEASDRPIDNVLRWIVASILVCGGLFLLSGLVLNFVSNPARFSTLFLLTTLLAVGYLGIVSLIAEFTRKLVTHPLVVAAGALVWVAAKLLIG